MQYILLAFFDKLCNFQQPALPKAFGRKGIYRGIQDLIWSQMIFEGYASVRLKLITISSSTSFYNQNLKEILFEQPSPLGALGRRFESCRPDHFKTKSYQRVSQLAFLFLICLKISAGEEWARICISLDNFGGQLARYY